MEKFYVLYMLYVVFSESEINQKQLIYVYVNTFTQAGCWNIRDNGRGPGLCHRDGPLCQGQRPDRQGSLRRG